MTAATLRSVPTLPPMSVRLADQGVNGPDDESREWVRSLRSEGPVRDDAVARLHALLLRAAAF
jgi:hypothetical protein